LSKGINEHIETSKQLTTLTDLELKLCEKHLITTDVTKNRIPKHLDGTIMMLINMIRDRFDGLRSGVYRAELILTENKMEHN